MTSPVRAYLLEQILEDCIAESVHDPDARARYIADYPMFAAELTELLDASLTPVQEPVIVDAADTEPAARPRGSLAALPEIDGPMPDPFAESPRRLLDELATRTGLPRGVLFQVLRDRLVLVETLPRWFLRAAAELVELPVVGLVQLLSRDPVPAVRSFSSQVTPLSGERESFEDILRDAGYSGDELERLSSDGR